MSRLPPHAWAAAVRFARATGGAQLLALGVPLALYVATASGASYWLDGGEFVAASVALDIAHPPGHPLTALYGKAWTLLPLGPIAFRIALGQAFAAALAALFAYRACVSTARALGSHDAVVNAALALVGAWLFALGYPVWFQAVRPEVYALQGALALFAIERLAHAHAPGTSVAAGSRALLAASFALGLGLANHHVMALFVFPALLWSAWTIARTRIRTWTACAALGVLALGTYVYLPLRAARQPPANFGDPTSWERFWWVVSARVYARHVGDKNPETLGQRFGDLGAVLVEHVSLIALAAALFGLYAALREREARRIGVFWLLCALPPLILRPWLGSVRGNPDAIAYMTSGFAALAALAVAALAAFASLSSEGPRARRGWIGGAWILAVAVALVQAVRVGPEVDLSRFIATDALDEFRQRQLPPRGVVVATTPQMVFRQLELAATERVRPDITVVPVPFLRYPGVAEASARSDAGVRRLIDAYLRAEALTRRALLGLAARRPLLIELDPHTSPSAYDVLLPAGVLHAVVGPAAARRALGVTSSMQGRIYARIDADLGASAREVETSHQLLWVHYMDALFYAARGHIDLARRALAAARALNPEDLHMRALAAALDAAPRTGMGIDVRPYLRLADAPPVRR